MRSSLPTYWRIGSSPTDIDTSQAVKPSEQFVARARIAAFESPTGSKQTKTILGTYRWIRRWMYFGRRRRRHRRLCLDYMSTTPCIPNPVGLLEIICKGLT